MQLHPSQAEELMRTFDRLLVTRQDFVVAFVLGGDFSALMSARSNELLFLRKNHCFRCLIALKPFAKRLLQIVSVLLLLGGGVDGSEGGRMGQRIRRGRCASGKQGLE